MLLTGFFSFHKTVFTVPLQGLADWAELKELVTCLLAIFFPQEITRNAPYPMHSREKKCQENLLSLQAGSLGYRCCSNRSHDKKKDLFLFFKKPSSHHRSPQHLRQNSATGRTPSTATTLDIQNYCKIAHFSVSCLSEYHWTLKRQRTDKTKKWSYISKAGPWFGKHTTKSQFHSNLIGLSKEVGILIMRCR